MITQHITDFAKQLRKERIIQKRSLKNLKGTLMLNCFKHTEWDWTGMKELTNTSLQEGATAFQY